MIEGLYSGLDDGPRLSSHALEAKMKLLVEAPAAVEDALASLLDHPDQAIQVRTGGRLLLQVLAVRACSLDQLVALSSCHLEEKLW